MTNCLLCHSSHFKSDEEKNFYTHQTILHVQDKSSLFTIALGFIPFVGSIIEDIATTVIDNLHYPGEVMSCGEIDMFSMITSDLLCSQIEGSASSFKEASQLDYIRDNLDIIMSHVDSSILSPKSINTMASLITKINKNIFMDITYARFISNSLEPILRYLSAKSDSDATKKSISFINSNFPKLIMAQEEDKECHLMYIFCEALNVRDPGNSEDPGFELRQERDKDFKSLANEVLSGLTKCSDADFVCSKYSYETRFMKVTGKRENWWKEINGYIMEENYYKDFLKSKFKVKELIEEEGKLLNESNKKIEAKKI